MTVLDCAPCSIAWCVVHGVLRYSHLASFFWMFIEGKNKRKTFPSNFEGKTLCCANMRRGRNPRRMERTKEKGSFSPTLQTRSLFFKVLPCATSALFFKKGRDLFLSLSFLLSSSSSFLRGFLFCRQIWSDVTWVFFRGGRKVFFLEPCHIFWAGEDRRIGGGDSGKKKMLGGRTYSIYHRINTTVLASCCCVVFSFYLVYF